MDFSVLLAIILIALVFDYINGFHDAANAIATVVSTKVMSPRNAVIYGAVLNFAGALMGTEVASTIGKGIVDASAVTPEVLIFTLLGAIVWNLVTWYQGLPSSSSHALIGSLCGATAFATGASFIEGWQNIHLDKLAQKVFLPMVTSPAIGLSVGFTLMLALMWWVRKWHLTWINKLFGRLQYLSSGYLALSHGSNDAQKSMGIIALALATYSGSGFEVPLWVKLACAVAMGLGTLSGGWKIIRTMSSKMIQLQPINGFAAEVTAGTVIMAASHFGIPLSTTHVISTSIMGVGATKRFSAVKWGVAGRMVWAWVLTFPISFLVSGGLYWAYHHFLH